MWAHQNILMIVFSILRKKTEGFMLSDKACERIGGKQFDVPQKKRLDLIQFYGENKYSDGTDIELGD